MNPLPDRIGHINLARGYRGGERQTELLIRGLSQIGWQQVLVARRGEPLALRCDGIRGLEVREVGSSPLLAALALKDLSMIHVHQGRSLLAAWLVHVFYGIPYIVTRRIQKGPRQSVHIRRMYSSAFCVAALSRSIEASVRSLNSDIRCRVIPSACSGLESDDASVETIRRSFDGQFIVGHVGALDDSHKGQLQIIEVARRIRDRAPDIQFVLVGSGRDEALLKAESEGLDNIHFTGQVDNVGDYLAAFDIFLFPSRHEGLGSVLLDVMQFGVPVIATRVGGIPDVIDDGGNGMLVEPNDIDGMTDAILRLKEDQTACARIGRTNALKAEDYSPARMVERYNDLYGELFDGSSVKASAA